MKRPGLKTTQARMALLIGALALAAALIAVMGITNAARFQQQLAELQITTQTLEQHQGAQTSLLKQQLAVKDLLLTDRNEARDLGELLRWRKAFAEYADTQLDPALGDAGAAAVRDSSSAYEAQVDTLVAMLYDETSTEEQILALINDQVDPAAAAVQNGVQARMARELQAMREQIAAIEASTQTSALVGQVALLLLAVLIVWGMAITFDIARPLDALTGAVVAFENNTYTPALLEQHTRRLDELGQLAGAVSGMAQSISESNRLKEQFLQAAQRFVPAQYLDFLEKDSITKVSLGDHVSAEMAVMFSDIRGFTTLSEKMSARENFDFVNEYLKLVSPIIQQHEGFIVKFLGDGMMAIFPYGVEDAVRAGIEKEMKVQEFNAMLRQRGLPEISVGIGIHTGNMMVGMIGEEMRMQGDAFSDNVNLTARIEGLNKFYGTSMIISEETLRQLPQPVGFKMRSLGKVVVKGRANPLGMYEVYEGLPRAVVEMKEATRAAFEQAVGLYAQGCFAEAGALFGQVLECDPRDKAARTYLESCAELVARPLPEHWSGAIVMDAK